jgi:hypothetical protein
LTDRVREDNMIDCYAFPSLSYTLALTGGAARIKA